MALNHDCSAICRRAVRMEFLDSVTRSYLPLSDIPGFESQLPMSANSKFEYRNPKQTSEDSEILQTTVSHLRRMAPKIFISSFASAASCWRSCSSLLSTSSKPSQ